MKLTHLTRLLTCALLCAHASLLQAAERPPLPEGVPDLTKDDIEIKGADWFLHCGYTRGWIWRDKDGSPDRARQILVTKVPLTSPVRHGLKVGDVILGVNGNYFTRHAVYEFRESSHPAQNAQGKLDLILWRKGWDEERTVTLDLVPKLLDFTKGETPGDYVDWNLGPTGARGWMQGQMNESFVTRQIYVTKVESGSPADGILQTGDVILGVGKQAFTSDARRSFGAAVTQAESRAGQGNLTLLRWRDGTTETVTIELPVLGSYSATTPWDCQKSRRILEQAVDYLLENDILNRKGIMHGEAFMSALALMSTGNEEHMALAKAYVYKLVDLVEASGDRPPVWSYSAWGWGYANLVLTEYTLLTGDEKALPAIRIFSRRLAEGQSGVGTWGHRMAWTDHGPCHGYGALNQIGNVCLLSLLLAQRCGVTSPEIERAVTMGTGFLKQFVDIQPIPYGDHPGLGPNAHDDNGKCSQAALIHALADDTDPARFHTRMTVASHAVRERGHTGNWFSHLWGPLGAARAGQSGCSAFLHEQTWLYDLERRWDGGFTYQGKMNTGYGVDPKTGRQKGGAEHQYGHWDTTCTRILMYTLPLRRLVISGRDLPTYDLPEEEVFMLIDAGRRPPRDDQGWEQTYDDRSVPRLLALLGHWSPVVRNFASQSLAKKPGSHVATLVALLDSDRRYARYGACSALRRLGQTAAPAVDALIAQLQDDDRLVRIHAAMALGAIGDRRAAAPLLELVSQEIPNDPRDLLRRFVSRALFARGGLLHESIDGVDRELLYRASRRLLANQGGTTRSLVAAGVWNQLTPDEKKHLWADMIPAFREVAPTEVMFASGIREAVGASLAEHRVVEGMALLLEYMRRQKPHGSGGRNAKIAGWIKEYGAAAKPLLPKLREYLAFLEQEHAWDDIGQPPLDGFYKGQIPHVKQLIEHIRTSTEEPDLVSIKPYLERE